MTYPRTECKCGQDIPKFGGGYARHMDAHVGRKEARVVWHDKLRRSFEFIVQNPKRIAPAPYVSPQLPLPMGA